MFLSDLTASLVSSLLGAAGGMFYFGYNTGVVSAPAVDIKKFITKSHKSHYDIDITDQTTDSIFTLIVSIFVVGGMLGAMSGGFVAHNMGRKRGLIISQFAGFLGSLVSAISKPLLAWEVLLVGRLVTGLAAGLNTVLVPMYLSEISPVSLRGGIGVLNQLSVTFGIFSGQVLGLTQILGNESGWPWLMAVSSFTAAAQLVLLVFFCPRSPRYLYITLGEEDEARRGLQKLRKNTDAVEEEIHEMEKEKQAEKGPDLNILEILRSRALAIPITICVVMHLSQQLSGINGIFYYAVPFFTKAGIAETEAKLANLGVGAIMVAMTLITIPLMDRLGRRFLHLAGLGGMCITTILIIIAQNLEDDAASYSLSLASDSSNSSLYPASDSSNSSLYPASGQGENPGAGEVSSNSIFLICVTLGYVVFFAVGPGSIPWIIAGELFPQSARPSATAVCVFVNWLANLLVGLLFDAVLVNYLKDFTFLPFTILLALFFIFVFLFLPETKGKTVGETTALLQSQGWRAARSHSNR